MSIYILKKVYFILNFCFSIEFKTILIILHQIVYYNDNIFLGGKMV